MIMELRNIAEKHKDDLVLTGHLNISLMCQDVAARLEELKPYENAGLTPEQVEYVKETAKKYLLEKAQVKVDGWIPVEERLPDEYDGLVLVQVSGKPRKNITLNNALQLACYISEAGEGWIVEEYPEWENPNVIAWRPLPEPYRPERSRK